MLWTEAATIAVSEPVVSFLDSIHIWTRKPHVVNRRLCGAKILWECVYNSDSEVEYSNIDHDTSMEDANSKRLQASAIDLGKSYCGIQSDRKYSLVMREMLPKNVDRLASVKEIVVIDEVDMCVTYLTVEMLQPDGSVTDGNEPHGYRLQLLNSPQRLSLQVLGPPENYEAQSGHGYTLPWLQDTLLPKLARWGVEKTLNTDVTSLRLLPVDRYNALYQQLKKKYGLPLVEKWPERTDPQKFVYEDVAIATYLLLLWEDDRQKKNLTKKQSFVDLGCGNGLLVYILQSEGHKGLGLDLRRRKIWDMYENNPNLVEQSITPSDENLYPTYDWLIGNHSDELTPWIPVMAARSSYECCYFVLPCCPWDFAAKFSQKAPGESQYRGYLNFVCEVGEECGFRVEEDTLRIPSTKRVCFVGRTRTYSESDEGKIDKRRKRYISGRCRPAPKTDEPETSSPPEDQTHFGAERATGTNVENIESHSAQRDSHKRKWASDFQARDSVERPRNCISVSSEVKERITSRVFRALLRLDDQQDTDSGQRSDGDQPWDKGVALPLGEVAELFDQQTLNCLKSECGGLQTLLRNHHHIFRVQAGKVALRDWRTDDYDNHLEKKRRRKGKTQDADNNSKRRLCYFHLHHPQGCPLATDVCRFAHGEADLRTPQPESRPT